MKRKSKTKQYTWNRIGGKTIRKYAREKGYPEAGFYICVKRYCPDEITEELFEFAEKKYKKGLQNRKLRAKLRDELGDKHKASVAFDRIHRWGYRYEDAIQNIPEKKERRCRK